jgi:hypothetical protein
MDPATKQRVLRQQTAAPPSCFIPFIKIVLVNQVALHLSSLTLPCSSRSDKFSWRETGYKFTARKRVFCQFVKLTLNILLHVLRGSWSTCRPVTGGFPWVRFGGLQEMTDFLCEWCSFLSENVCSYSNVHYTI